VFILYAVPVGLLLGWLLGGRLSGLAALQFRWAGLILGGLLVQVALFSGPVSSVIDATVGTVVYVGSTAAVLVGVARNIRLPGIAIVVAGAASNLAAIVANGGYMPVSAAALAAQGRNQGSDFSNSRLTADPALAPLTDILAMPTWMPFSNVFSIGDLLIGAGVVVIVVTAMRRPATPTASREPGFGPVRADTDPNGRDGGTTVRSPSEVGGG
jgi:hypothetical protein